MKMINHFTTSVGLLVALALPAQAQKNTTQREPFRIGLEASFNAATYAGSDRESLAGGSFGIRAEYDILKHAYVSASLRYAEHQIDEGNNPNQFSWYEVGYIELPLSLGGFKPIGRHLGLFAETGPYFAYGVGGHAAEGAMAEGYWFLDTDQKRFFCPKVGSPRRFDLGWGAQAGFAFRHCRFTLGYQLGFIPVWKSGNNPDLPHTAKYRNATFSFGFAYLFY